ncbi:division/cell wall cluster transcriptional repressor MraZ [Teredinibacter sp. KSP-S5-2]|uniref:division/cell wall cluster transcriptional repressor MraZ n=1 Tax=Teredinibacter sp. KSP-S5-2 TaxID=3034506 RepID=UPI0029342F79|nr:division/cell wall cluster transcriptional repressor MraZ [Teredinibacter sp. KSP-S5-2]WNO09609.1 division/cell wall cluster transcriptional repressor MraZ [Teredinibacter sp. KSP-S5-2]
MYQGSHSINMDAKGRMAIPAKYRDDLAADCAGRIVMTAHTQDRCVLLYPEPEWQNILPKIEALPTFNKAALRAQRMLIGYACALELDGNGRILVPPTLREYAGLEKKLMLVGLGKKFELWSEDAWFASVADLASDDELPDEMLSLSL